MNRPFLTARWQDLALISYDCAPEQITPFLPAGCEPDVVDGRARCSLVAFDFLDARVLGVKWPWHVNFPEVNLRFYVKRDGVRGVSFLSEFVPRLAIPLIARAIYNEPYTAVPMRSAPRLNRDSLTVNHALRVRGRWQRITVTGRRPTVVPPADGVAHWIKEHHWGFGQTRGGRPLSYQVNHPKWAVYPDARAELDFDFGHVYGPAFAFLNKQTPSSTVLAVGSQVSVSPKKLDGKAH